MRFTAVLTIDSAHGAGVPAALEHVANRPILHHALDGLAAARVDGIIVAGEADTLIDVRACVEERRPDVPIQYAVSRGGTKLASTLRAVAPLVGEDACLLQPADGLFDGPLPSLLDLLNGGGAELVLLPATRTERRLGAASPHEDSGTGHALQDADVGVFAPGALLRASRTIARWRDVDLPTAGRMLAADGAEVRMHPLEIWRRYGGNRQQLIDLNRVVLDHLSVTSPAAAGPTNRIAGRVQIDPTARITNSVLLGPAIIGAGAEINDAYIGPYTSIGAEAQIDGAEIEGSIVLERARVLHVGGRLACSLVGRGATVYHDVSLPRALRLLVGSEVEIELC